MKKFLKDPLLHFLVLGLGLFVLFDLVGGDDDAYDSRIIDVDRESLLTFVQYRTRAFEPRLAAERLDGMADEELEKLIRDYVREEALHREAIALGVDKNDYIIKRRMIQSIEFVTDSFVNASLDVSDEDVAAHYAANRDDYYVNPFVTFTHVFFGRERHSRDEALELAAAKLAELNGRQVPFADAPQHGERFPFFVNYVERDPRFVASHFGARMAEQIFALEIDDTTWHGPFESEYGMHLVMLTRKAEGRYPDLEDIEAAVRADTEREAIAKQKDEAIQAIVDTYEVRRNFDPQLVGQAQ
jgi:hypothetical protein